MRVLHSVTEIFTLDGSDACVTPVLEKHEAPSHPHNKARASFLPSGLPRPAPTLSRTPASASSGSDRLEFGSHTAEILAEEGFSQDTIHRLLREKIAQRTVKGTY